MKTSARKLASRQRYCEKHRERVRESNRLSYQRLRKRRLADKRIYFQKNKAAINLRRRRVLQTNMALRIEDALRRRINNALKKQFADRAHRFRDLVGCSPMELKDYIESKFSARMGWDNRALWHIDHIRPCVTFDLTDPAQQRACFHFLNLQPLWIVDNLQKGARWKNESR